MPNLLKVPKPHYQDTSGFHHRMLRARLRYDLIARGRDGWGPLGTAVAGDRWWGPPGTPGMNRL